MKLKFFGALLALCMMSGSVFAQGGPGGEYDEFEWPYHDAGNTWSCWHMSSGACGDIENRNWLPTHHDSLCGSDPSCVAAHIYRDNDPYSPTYNRYWQYRTRESWMAPNGVLVEQLTPTEGLPMSTNCFYTGGVVTCP